MMRYNILFMDRKYHLNNIMNYFCRLTEWTFYTLDRRPQYKNTHSTAATGPSAKMLPNVSFQELASLWQNSEIDGKIIFMDGK